MTVSSSEVRNDEVAGRYELTVDGDVAFAAYRIEGDTVVFTHTIVPVQVEGRGIGSELIRTALADVRQRGLKVQPDCPFVAAYIDRHPDERDLLA